MRLPIFIHDIATSYATYKWGDFIGGLIGNVAASVTGSFSLHWKLERFDSNGDAVVSLTLSNPMSAKSFLKLPLLGYTDYWKSNISPAIDHVFNSEANITGFMHTVNMTMTWTTTIKKVQ